MKTLTSKSKLIISTYFLVFAHFVCQAQSMIADLKDGSTYKAISQSYSVKIIDKKISIGNIKNKFTAIKQYSPKLYGHIPGSPNIILDENQLSKIFLKHISRKQLETLVDNDIYARIMIDIKTDIYGKILELDFFTAKNSILSLQQLEQIENEIKSTKLVTISPETSIRLEGSNFWRLWPFILYDDLLKLK